LPPSIAHMHDALTRRDSTLVETPLQTLLMTGARRSAQRRAPRLSHRFFSTDTVAGQRQRMERFLL